MIDLKQLAEFIRHIVREELAAQQPQRSADLVTIDAYAAARSISRSTVRQAIRDGRLPATRFGRAVRVDARVEIGEPGKKQDITRSMSPSPSARAERILRMARKRGGV